MSCSELGEEVLYYINLISSILSLIGSLLVIYFIISKGLFSTLSFKILFYMSVNDTLRSLASIFQSFILDPSKSCTIICFLVNFQLVSNLFWALSLSATIYQIIVLELTDFEKYHKYWFILSYVVVGCLEISPITTDSFVYSQGRCQLGLDWKGEVWRLMIVYFPAAVILIISFYLFAMVYKKLKVFENFSIKTLIFDRGFIYAGIASLVCIPLMVLRIVQIFVDGCFIIFFIDSMYVAAVLQGVFNSVVFFLNKTVQKYYLEKNIKKVLLKAGAINADVTDTSLRISYASDIN